jgi:hypothetical protein
MSEQMKIIREHFSDKGLSKVATREVGKKTLSLFAPFDAQLRIILPIIGNQMFINNEKSQKMLGMKYERDLDQSLIEMVQAMIDHGIIKTNEKKMCNIF